MAWNMGSVVVEYRLSYPMACGISSQTKDQAYVGRQFLNHWTIREALSSLIFIYLMCSLRVTYDVEMDTEFSEMDGSF